MMKKKFIISIIVTLLILGSVNVIGLTQKNNMIESNEKEQISSNNVGLTNDEITALQDYGEQAGWTFTVGETSATQYSKDQLCGTRAPEDFWLDAPPSDTFSASGGLPDSFDWRNPTDKNINRNCLTEIRNQGGCGSCWAFATVAPLESAILREDGEAVDLSEQYLVSCNNERWGCNGGYFAHMYHAGTLGKSGVSGAILESDCPYRAADIPCYEFGNLYPKYILNRWSYIEEWYSIPSVDKIKQAIWDYGPISCCVTVDDFEQGDAFVAYNGGVFNFDSKEDISHAVVLVGWDDNPDDGGPDCPGVWILRNSWDTDWGENGYMRIEYGCAYIGYGACYIDGYTDIGVGVTVTIKEVSNKGLGELDKDPFEEPEWYYRVSMSPNPYDKDKRVDQHKYNRKDYWWIFDDWESEYTWEVNAGHYFEVENSIVDIEIKLKEHDDGIDDPLHLGADDLADVSAMPGGGEDNEIPDKREAMYRGTYNLITKELTGDTVVEEGGWLVSTGDGNPNAARVKFKITDSLNVRPILDVEGDLIITETVNPGEKQYHLGYFTIKNIGDDPYELEPKVYSYLDWEISTIEMDWGTNWKFVDSSGNDLKSGSDLKSGNEVKINVYVDVPKEPEKMFSGRLKVLNMDNYDNKCYVTVRFTTPRNSQLLITDFQEIFRMQFPFLQHRLNLIKK